MVEIIGLADIDFQIAFKKYVQELKGRHELNKEDRNYKDNKMELVW